VCVARNAHRLQFILDRSNIPILCLLLLPLFVKDFYHLQIIDMIGIYIIFSISINILTGFLGQISFGQAGFWGIGAYTSALLCTKLHFPFWLDLVSAVAVTGLFGFLIGLPALRLRGSYLALATLSFGLIVQLVLFRWMSLTNGPNGVNDIPPAFLFGVKLDTQIKVYYLLWCFLFMLHIFCKHLKCSRIGYAMQSVKIDEIASSMVGINIVGIKLLGFILSAMIAGLSGSLLAHFMGYIAPELFSVDASIIVLTIMVLGGAGTLAGPWFGSALIIGSSEYFRFLGHYREIGCGIMIVLVLIFMPQGLQGAVSTALDTAKRLVSHGSLRSHKPV
jgi:branched-chain amino acid transport system permease protein